MTDTFTWRVHDTASGGSEFITARTDFGDGYEQEVPLGLMPEKQKWNVTTEAYAAEMRNSILAFLRAHIGTAFFWTPPMGVQGYYKCRRFNPTPQGAGLWTVAMEFEQVGSL
jgi:phage-related protein